jgi:O-antigen/teichoic acid export membrane protein
MTTRGLGALIALEAASLAVMSTLHLSGTLGNGSKPFDRSHAGIAEAIICVVLCAGAVVFLRAGPNGRAAAIGAVVFAILGFILGLTFTIRGGDAIDVTYHATVLPLLVVTLVALVRLPGRRTHGAEA